MTTGAETPVVSRAHGPKPSKNVTLNAGPAARQVLVRRVTAHDLDRLTLNTLTQRFVIGSPFGTATLDRASRSAE